MSRFRQNPILTFLVHMTQSALLRQIAYLKAENGILRSRLPRTVQTTPAERSLLVRIGSPLGSGIREIIGIVHYKTFLRWGREEFGAFYNSVRPHQGIGNRPIGVIPFPPPGTAPPGPPKVECESRLGGLLRHYHRKAA